MSRLLLLPAPVSTSRSSNRTCGFPASGSRTRTQECAHKERGLGPATPPAASELFLEVSGSSPISRSALLPALTLNRGPFPPPSLPASSVLWTSPTPQAARPVPRGRPVGVTTPTAWGLPCCVDSPFVDMPSPLPRWDRRRDRVAPLKLRPRPSPSLCWVGSHIVLFEACSAFTHVTACLLAESPKRPSPSKAPAVSLPSPPLRLLPAGATVAGWDLHPLKNHAFHGAQRRTKGTRTET